MRTDEFDDPDAIERGLMALSDEDFKGISNTGPERDDKGRVVTGNPRLDALERRWFEEEQARLAAATSDRNRDQAALGSDRS